MKKKITYLKSVIGLLMITLLFSANNFAQTPVFHFDFDNNLTDSSANGYTLTPQGTFAAAYENDKDATANSALTYPATAGNYLLSNYSGISGTAARTITAWVKTTGTGSRRHTIVSWGTNASEKMFNVMIHDGSVRVEAGASNIRTATSLVNDNNWHHIAVTFSTANTLLNQCKIYIDATEIAIATNFNGGRIIDTANDSKVTIGEAFFSATHYFGPGALDDVRIYDVELTPAQIQTVSGITATAPVAGFSVDNTTPNTDQIVTFTDSSTNTPTIWTWDFGAADAVGDSGAQNPQVSYPTAGTYQVTLTASNAGGSDDEVKAGYITVSPSGGSGDLQLQYNFDNNTNDVSSYGRNLSTTGSFTPTYENNFKGNASSALTASGVSGDHLITGYPGIGGTNNRSITAWFKTTGTAREPIVSYGENSSGKMFNVMIDNGVPRVEGGASSLKTTNTGLNDDNWHHIAVTYDSADGTFLSDVKIYIDGILSTNEADAGASFGSETTTINTDSTTNFLKIGSEVYASYAFDGAIDDVRIYSKALTASEVKEVATNIYNTASGSWSTAGNWSYGSVPISTENAFIPSGNAVTIGSSTGAVTNNLDIAGTLTISKGGSLIVSGTSTGNVTYNRELTYVAGDANGWHLISSPVSGQTYNNAYATANNLATDDGNTKRGLAYYDDSKGAGLKYTYLLSDDTNAAAFNAGTYAGSGIGYSAKRGSTGNIAFTGTINTDNVNGVGVSTAGNGFNLLGNPYTSYISSQTFLNDNTDLDQTQIWVWKQDNSSGGNFIAMTNKADNFILAPGQGFFVKATTATPVNFLETNQQANGDTFQKSARTEIKLLMNDGETNRFAKLYYLDNVTKGFDAGYEGEVFGGIKNSLDVFSHLVENNQGKNYQVQSLPKSEMESITIPVGIFAQAGKELSFSVEALNLPSGIKVYLEDRLLNTFTRLDEVNSEYKITLTEALKGTGRLYIHTANSALSTESEILDSVSIYKLDNSTLRIAGLSQGKTTVSLFNILGKKVMATSFDGANVNTISLPSLATGVYVVKLQTASGKLNKKIILE